MFFWLCHFAVTVFASYSPHYHRESLILVVGDNADDELCKGIRSLMLSVYEDIDQYDVDVISVRGESDLMEYFANENESIFIVILFGSKNMHLMNKINLKRIHYCVLLGYPGECGDGSTAVSTDSRALGLHAWQNSSSYPTRNIKPFLDRERALRFVVEQCKRKRYVPFFDFSNASWNVSWPKIEIEYRPTTWKCSIS